jgi:hypothetical protein
MSSRVHIDDPDEQFWIEGRGERLELAREAGWGKVSWWSVAVGVLTAIGFLGVLVGATAAIVHATGTTTDTLTDSEWKRLGLVGGIAAAVAVLGAFMLGAYAAGRMARRAGLRHGILVFVAGAAVLAAAVGTAHLEGALSAVRERLDDLGAPTGDSAWGGIALLTIGVAVAGALAGSLFGGARGERWHQRLVARALDPEVGPEAEQRRAAAKALERAHAAGVITESQELPAGVVREPQPTEAASAPTAAEPSMSPSSQSSGP